MGLTAFQFRASRRVVRAALRPGEEPQVRMPRLDALTHHLPGWTEAAFGIHRFGAVRAVFRAAEAGYCRHAYRIFEQIAAGRRVQAARLLGGDGSRVRALEQLRQWNAWPRDPGTSPRLRSRERVLLDRFAHHSRVFTRRCDVLGNVLEQAHPMWWPKLIRRLGNAAAALAMLDRQWCPDGQCPRRNTQYTTSYWRWKLSGFHLLAWGGTGCAYSAIQKDLGK